MIVFSIQSGNLPNCQRQVNDGMLEPTLTCDTRVASVNEQDEGHGLIETQHKVEGHIIPKGSHDKYQLHNSRFSNIVAGSDDIIAQMRVNCILTTAIC